MRNLYLIDPYYADSHRYWAEQIANNLNANTRIFHLSPKHWKWRMEGAAIELANEINQIDLVPDAFLVTDYLNLSLFKSLLNPKFLKSKFLVYMHENQLTYPFSEKDSDIIEKRDSHYGFINYTSCLVADSVAFNSQYHKNVFLNAVQSLSDKLPNRLPIESIIKKSTVIPSIISTEGFSENLKNNQGIKTIVWNHRWDYDKRPGVFLDAMITLQSQNLDFKLILLGRMDQKTKRNYEDHLHKLKNKIFHIGYADSRAGYIQLLEQSDIIISTSIHDFLGLSIAEGIYAGCRPVLPYDLAYPELVEPTLHSSVFHERINLLEALSDALKENWSVEKQNKQRKYIEDKLTWQSVEQLYEKVLFN